MHISYSATNMSAHGPSVSVTGVRIGKHGSVAVVLVGATATLPPVAGSSFPADVSVGPVKPPFRHHSLGSEFSSNGADRVYTVTSSAVTVVSPVVVPTGTNCCDSCG